MNTEEKAKAYDEALDRAKKELQTCGSTDCDAARQIFRFFPELRESEDERIIVRLIEYFQGFLEGYEDCYKDGGCVKWEGLDVKSILAWLERQKENSKSADSIPSNCTSDAKCEDRWHKVEDSLPDNGRLVLANDCLGNTLLARYDGEGNWEVSVYDNDDYYCQNTITKWCEIPSEKQKEQKPVQSEEEKEYVRTLKGLVSDFIRNSGGGITDIEYYQNICDWLDGRHIEQKPNIEICPHSIKSKSYKENGYPIEDCDYGLEIAQDILEKTLGKVEGYQSDDGIREHLTAIQAVKDAMKEQKPAEGKEYSSPDCGTTAGYTNDESEYDKGYKEGHRFGLQQTQEYMLPGGRTFMGLIPCWVNAPSELQPAHKYHGKNVVVMHENNGGFRCTCIDDEKATTFHLPENTLFVEGWRKKPAEWSEEDEEMLNSCISSIEESKENRYAYKENDGDTSYDREIAWLKSLRPQQKVEWSEEDEEMFQEALTDIIYAKNELNKKGCEGLAKSALDAFNWLNMRFKSLRHEPKQEWDTHDKAIVNCIACCLDGQFVTEAARKQCLEWFNKHRRDFLNRPSWKPSEHQMSILKAVKEYVGKGSGYWGEGLGSLIDDLEKLM